MVDIPSSPASELDFSPNRIPENGSEGSELPAPLEDWSDGEKELDSDRRSPGLSSKTSFLCVSLQGKDVATTNTPDTEAREAELQQFRRRPQQCGKRRLMDQRMGKPVACVEETGPSHERHLRLKGACRKKGPAEDGQEVLEKLDTQPSRSDDIVQLIDEDGVYSSAKLVPITEMALSPYLTQHLERHSGEGEEFEIQEVIVDEKPFQCVICAKAFKRAWELFSHEVVHNEERPFCCQLCQVISGGCSVCMCVRVCVAFCPASPLPLQASFKRHSDYKSHALVHTEERPHRCELCGKCFKRASNLAEHRRIHSGERPHRCAACTKRFKTPYELQRHMLTHCLERPFTCTACGKGFAAAGALLLHQRQHCDDKPHICGICGKRFAYGHSLRVHERVHTGDRPFSCVLCSKAFKQSNALASHERVHTGERPFACATCGKAFKQSSYLAIHARSHTGERPYACGACGKAFARPSLLLQHQRVHSTERPHRCQHCGKLFKDLAYLAVHEKVHTAWENAKLITQ
ncbi:zinc finger protein 774-like isoform X2 [Rhineura floridana]|uniref:zinc finger protein 774-like isoform X2 n=1 Tax=Rhineura floridana TaxID=261503 RepID=UPI002AC7E927|nr:zinc finger protein 774-like isoform X2 [Rhineura floridana]